MASLCCWCCVSFIALDCQSQTSSWYTGKLLNDNNGLPQNSVRSMYFDQKTAFLWMTTEAGLVRFDGVNCRVYDARDLSSLSSIRMLRFVATIKNMVLVSNRHGEMFPLIEQPINKVVGKDSIIADLEERKSNVKSPELNRMTDQIFNSRMPQPEIISNSLWLNENEWIGISATQIGYFNNDKLLFRWKHEFTGKKIVLERSGFVYMLGPDGNGFSIDLVTKELKKTFTESAALTTGNRAFYYDRLNDQPFLLNGSELYQVKFDAGHLSAKLIAVLPALPTFITGILLHPNKKIVFVATNTSGVHIYHQSPFHVYKTRNDDVLNNNYASVLLDSSHLFTCRSVLYDLNSGKSMSLPVNISHDRSLTMDTSGNIWTAYQHSIINFKIDDPDKVTRIMLPGNGYLQTSLLATDKKLWISTDKFLGYTAGKKILPFVNFWGETNNTSFYHLAETDSGVILGVNNLGIYAVDAFNKKIVPFLVSDSVTRVRTVYYENRERCWICTYGNGNFLFNPSTGKITRLAVDEKGYMLFSHAMIEDGMGNFILPTNKGMFRLNKSNLLAMAFDKNVPLYYEYFDVSDGLATNEFNGGCQPGFLQVPGGDILLPALQGLVRVKIKELRTPVPYPLFVDMVETNKEQHQSAESKLRFSEEERTQTWHLGFAQWEQTKNQGVFYRLDDDTSWKRVRIDEKKLQLTELKGGDHELEIRYQYGLLANEFSQIRQHFYIEKRFYEIPLFWLAVAATLVLLLYLINWQRSLALKQKNRRLQQIILENTRTLHEKNTDLEETLLDLNEALKSLKENSIFKNRLIGLLSHDMIVPLRFIATVSSHLDGQKGTLSAEAAAASSSDIKHTAEELLLLGESLLQWIKLLEGNFRLIFREIKMENLIREVTAVHKPVMNAKGNRLVIDIKTGSDCVYDPVFLKVILHNLLLNANKFSSKGTITISTEILENYLSITVRDTGVGMDASIVNSLNNLSAVSSKNGTGEESGWGMGYILIIDLLRFADGQLFVQSAPGKGSVVKFSLPLMGVPSQVQV